MASESTIILYEPASLNGTPYSPYSRRVRYALGFKSIPYKTIQLEYPNIEATLRSIGAAPTSTKPDGQPYYTLPVIVDPSSRSPEGGATMVSGSWAIAEYLDEAYPTPEQLFPVGTKALQRLFHDHFHKTVISLGGPITSALVPPLLNEASRSHWRQTIEACHGKKLEEVCPKGSPAWEEGWANLQKGFADVAALLDKNGPGGGQFVMGTKVTFADFIIASGLESLVATVPEEWEQRVKQWDNSRWETLRVRCTVWSITK